MYALFGSGELTLHGYVLDVKIRNKLCSRLPVILTDSNLICGTKSNIVDLFFFTLSSLGRRIALGSNGIAQTTQLITNLIVGNKNATEGVEAPRFYLLDNSTIAVEGGSFCTRNYNSMLKY